MARAAVGRVMRGRLAEARREDALLLVSEAVTNSVLHGGAAADETIELTVIASDDRLRVEVADPLGGFASPPYPDDDELSEGGRGLPLIDSLAQAWGVDDAPDGRVWFELASAAA